MQALVQGHNTSSMLGSAALTLLADIPHQFSL